MHAGSRQADTIPSLYINSIHFVQRTLKNSWWYWVAICEHMLPHSVCSLNSSLFPLQCDLPYRQVDQMEIEELYKEHSFIGWTETSAKEGLMVNDSMKWEIISSEKLFQWLDTLLNVFVVHTSLGVWEIIWNNLHMLSRCQAVRTCLNTVNT